MKLDTQSYLLSDTGVVGRKMLIAGIVGVLLSLLGYILNPAQFFHSYLVAYIFWLSVALGALFFVMLHHLVAAKWSIVLRRLVEVLAQGFPLMAVLFIPIILGLPYLYEWNHKEIVAADAVLQGKELYLNVPFFIIRAAIYFAVWIFLSRRLYKISLQQDDGFKPEQVRKFRVISATGIIVYAFTLSFAAFDWLMSLDARWYSTVFGVYIYSGSVVGILGVVIIACLYLRRKNVLSDVITVEHYHDLGKLLFTFIIFWAYIAFSQYMLIWYANVPEETIWFRNRWTESWKTVSLLIVFGHFAVPFFILMTRSAKRNFGFLAVLAGWMLFMHWVDIYWLVLPGLHKGGAVVSWIDPITMLAVSGLFLWNFWRMFVTKPIVPIGDPHLKESIEFVNRY